MVYIAEKSRQSRFVRVECPEDGKLSPERRIQKIRGAYPAFRCHIEINLLYVVCHKKEIFYVKHKKIGHPVILDGIDYNSGKVSINPDTGSENWI